MYFLFIDESGNPSLHGKSVVEPFVLGGVAIPDGAWKAIDSEIKALKASYGVFGELKWRDFGHHKPSSVQSLSMERRNEFRDEFFAILVKRKAVRIIAVLGDPAAYATRGAYRGQEFGLYVGSLKTLSERFQYFLQDQSREMGEPFYGLMVCDCGGAARDKRLTTMIASMMDPHFVPWVSRYDNIIEGLFMADSVLSTGIQIADMVAGVIWRHFAGKDSRWFNVIEPRIRRSPSGKIEGYGIAREPHK